MKCSAYIRLPMESDTNILVKRLSCVSQIILEPFNPAELFWVLRNNLPNVQYSQIVCVQERVSAAAPASVGW